MFETITFTEMIKWIGGSFLAGVLAGLILALYLEYRTDKSKKKKS